MPAAQQVFVTPEGNRWTVKFNNEILTTRDAQVVASAFAHSWLLSNGGGELVVLNEQGQIRQKDTIAPGKDPTRSKG